MSDDAPPIISVAAIEAARLISRVYEFSGVGGNAHIVLDDDNIEDRSIRWCLDEAMVANHHKSTPEALAAERTALEALLKLSIEERRSAITIYWRDVDIQSHIDRN